MSLLAPPASAPGKAPLSVRIVDKVGSLLLSTTSRRGFLAGTALVGAAAATDFKGYALRPASAYDAICGDTSGGYTAFCCTINAGKNTCPPGSLVGGWWKADGSGFCCGGARYYIDCHYQCSCGCSGGSKFCSTSCTPVGCHTAVGTCDNRRVNCNVFRYGQCNTNVSCTGPVLCRVISCTPPWQLYSCSTSSATDNATGGHNAPCLPGKGCVATIDQWWYDHGGLGSTLGATTDPAVTPLPNGGSRRSFVNGVIEYSPSFGLHTVMAPLAAVYVGMGQESGALGYPTAEQAPDGTGGTVQRFERGVILVGPQTGAVAIADFYAIFQGAGGARVMGYPTAADGPVPGGTRQRFQLGNLYWSQRTGGHVLMGLIRDRYVRAGESGGVLGMPTRDAYAAAYGSAADFEHGRIQFNAPTRQTQVVLF